MARQIVFEIPCKIDPMFQAMFDEAQRCPEWQKKAMAIVDKGEACITGFVQETICATPSDELVVAYYEHMESKS